MPMKRPHNLLFVLCWLIAGLGSSAAAGGYALRTVQPGDSLGAIAALYRLPLETLMSYNGLTSELIHPGVVLKIPYAEATGGVAEVAPKPPPGFLTHSLRSGETLLDVALRYGLELEALVGANPDLSSLDQLRAGLELLVPPRPGLSDLIRAYGLDPVEVIEANGFASPADLKPGTLVFLPGVAATDALARLEQVREEAERYQWPVYGRITSYFGRRNLGMGTSSFHRAIDIAAPSGTPVVAARAGTVVQAGWSQQGYGNLVKLRHAGGAETGYAHNSELLVSVGQSVDQGATIALIGSTGLSTGPHLHFEVRDNGQAVDPMSFLP